MGTTLYNALYGSKDRASVEKVKERLEAIEDEPKPMKFWMCYMAGDLADVTIHNSLEEAQEEAKRLAWFNPGKPVYVLECVGRYEIAYSPVIWKETE